MNESYFPNLLPWPLTGGQIGDLQRALRGRMEVVMMRAILALRAGELSYEEALTCIGEMAGLQATLREFETELRRREKQSEKGVVWNQR